MINSLQEQCFVHIMIEFCTMSSVPYFTHTHFGLQVVSLHDNQQHERRGIYGTQLVQILGLVERFLFAQ